MEALVSALPYAEIILSILLIGGVVLQQRGASLGGAFGGRRDIKVLEALGTRVKALTPGDRALLYLCTGVLATATLLGLYAIEQSLLVSVPGYGGTLTEGEGGSPRFINPLLAISDADRDLTALTYAGLMGIGGDGGLIPVLAEEYSISP